MIKWQAYTSPMKKLLISLSVFIFLPLMLISGNDVGTLDKGRMELLNNRQYRFFEYSYFDSGFYTIQMDVEVDENTTLKFETYVHSSGDNTSYITFDYDYYSSRNMLYHDSTMTIIADDEKFFLIDDNPYIFKSANENGSLRFKFDLIGLSQDELPIILKSNNLKFQIGNSYLDLQAYQIERIKNYFNFIIAEKLTLTDMHYLEQKVTIQKINVDEMTRKMNEFNKNSLFEAIEKDELEKVRSIITYGLDLSSTNEDGYTPLLWASSKSSNPNIISLLLDNGAYVNEKDSDGWTPLMRASAFNENPEIVQILLDNGADVNEKGDNGETALFKSIIFNRNNKIIQLLIDSGADVNIVDELGYTPLMEVPFRLLMMSIDDNIDKNEVIDLLLTAGADINAKSKSGQTVLTLTNDPEVEEILVRAGAIGLAHIAWQKKFYVDSFGDPTEKPYITNIGRIKGVFSNSATNGSELGVYFIIDSMDDIQFKLFEYNGNNPVKSYSTTKYDISVKDKNGNIHKLYGSNSSDRIRLVGYYATTLHGLLSKNDLLKFHVVESDNRITTYDFEVDCRGYDSVYNDLAD